MKNSKNYSKKVLKLYGSLKKKRADVQKAVYEEPVNALVYAIISEHIAADKATSALKRFDDYFVDLNDLRVSRTDDIVEMIGIDTPAMHETAARLTRALRCIFDEHHQVSLESLKKMGKRPARTALEKTDGVSKFAVDYCMLTALGGHTIPLTSRMLDYLRDNELVNPDATEQEIGGFLAKQISAKNGYEFYDLLRSESESHKKKTTKTRTPTKKVKK
ncbi:MAG: hypothetical protein JXN61_08635 [Sedimentisphaerales bacterium]|nr:hypothetical protein [Sedimentisphaerales bacterium]